MLRIFMHLDHKNYITRASDSGFRRTCRGIEGCKTKRIGGTVVMDRKEHRRESCRSSRRDQVLSFMTFASNLDRYS